MADPIQTNVIYKEIYVNQSAGMSKALRVSGYVALTIQMLWGILQVHLLSPMGPGAVPGPSVGAHAHFGVLSILAVVTSFAIERTDLTGTRRSFAVWGFIAGQWLLPATVLMELVAPQLLLTAYLWGLLLAISMAIVAWATITAD